MPQLVFVLAASLTRTLEQLWDALKSVPDIVANFIAYFGDVPGEQLADSLVVGLVFGAVFTAIVFLVGRRWLILPSFSQQQMVAALAIGVLAYSQLNLFGGLVAGVVAAYLMLRWNDEEVLAGTWEGTNVPLSVGRAVVVGAAAFFVSAGLDVGLLEAIGVVFLALVGLNLLYGASVRRFLSAETARRLAHRGALSAALTGAGVGAVVGALGSQILMYPTKHCTYGAEIAPFEYRLGLVVTAISALILLLPLWMWFLRRTGALQPGTEITSGNFRGLGVPFLLLLPTLIILVFFLYYPAVQVVQMSLTRALLGGRQKFACLANYENLVTDPVYENSFFTTFQITIAIILIGMGLALGIAVLASQKVRGASFYRTWLIWPYAVSPVVTGAIFSLIFHPQVGPVNWILNELFGIRPLWFSDVSLTPWVVILAAIWNSLGFNILFYVAGLQNIPSDLLEAAAIDGANRFQRFFRITFPMLSPFTFFLLVTNVTYSFFGIFGAVDTLTQGGPWRLKEGGMTGATNVLIYNLYQDAFERQNKIGLAASQSLILFLLVAGLTILQFRYVERQVTYGG